MYYSLTVVFKSVLDEKPVRIESRKLTMPLIIEELAMLGNYIISAEIKEYDDGLPF